MSKPRYGWWGYVKWIIRQAPRRDGVALEGKAAEEQAAVNRAISQIKNKPDANARLMLIDLVFFKQTHTLDGAAQAVSCSERTARRWSSDFIVMVAKERGLL